MAGVRFLQAVVMEFSPSTMLEVPDAFLHSLVYFFSSYKEFSSCREKLLRSVVVRPSGLVQCAPLVESSGWKHSTAELKSKGGSVSVVQEVGSGSKVAEVMRDIGFACAASVGQFEMLLSRFSEITVQDIAQIIGMVCMDHANLDSNGSLYTFGSARWGAEGRVDANAWNLNVIVEVLCRLVRQRGVVVGDGGGVPPVY